MILLMELQIDSYEEDDQQVPNLLGTYFEGTFVVRL